MPRLTGTQARPIVDKLLGNVSNQYMPPGYISELIFPKLPVKESSGLLGGYGQQHLRIQTTLMVGKSGARRVETVARVDQNYRVQDHGLEDIVTKADFRNVEKPYDARRDKTEGLTTAMWLGKEIGLASVLTSTAVLTQNTTLAGNDQFSDYVNSDPVSVIKDAQLAVYNGCGKSPNAAFMPWPVFQTMRYSPQVLESLGYRENRVGKIRFEELKDFLEVDELFVADVKFNSAAEGQADSLTDVWNKDIVMFVRPARPGLRQLSLGYNIHHMGEQAREVQRTKLHNPPKSESIIVTDAYDLLVSDAKCGFLIKNAIA